MQNKHQNFFFSFGGPNFGGGGGVDLVEPNSQIFPKIRFEGSPKGFVEKQWNLMQNADEHKRV